ncbi:MAG TPA: toll/interleukin-1 receptor domain-containing protein [Pyrinomonadaceae bacterium]|jgi:hypothetical protein
MADVFISYSSKDRERAHLMASALESRGWTVWWDRKLLVGQSYDQVIEQELEQTKSVVVLWSQASILSEWVKNEAAVAAERGILVPALIDNIKIPLEFRRRQTADLVDWNGDPSHSGFLALCDGIAAKVAGVEPVSPPQLSPSVSSASRRIRPWMLGAMALLGLAVMCGVYWGLMRPTQTSMSGEEVKPAASESAETTGSIADSVAGTYDGDVVADSQGSSRSGVTVTVVKVDKRKVRVTSDYERLGETELELTTTGNLIVGNGMGATLSLDVDQNPPRLDYNPGGVVFAGQKR